MFGVILQKILLLEHTLSVNSLKTGSHQLLTPIMPVVPVCDQQTMMAGSDASDESVGGPASKLVEFTSQFTVHKLGWSETACR